MSRENFEPYSISKFIYLLRDLCVKYLNVFGRQEYSYFIFIPSLNALQHLQPHIFDSVSSSNKIFLLAKEGSTLNVEEKERNKLNS